jgi:signal recognition particle receptor subunit beta
MWDDLVKGAIGAVVLVDTRRLADCFPAIDYFEEAKLPFVVGINGWDGGFPHMESEIREALTLSPHIPLVRTDARSREAVKSTLITLVEHAMAARTVH